MFYVISTLFKRFRFNVKWDQTENYFGNNERIHILTKVMTPEFRAFTLGQFLSLVSVFLV